MPEMVAQTGFFVLSGYANGVLAYSDIIALYRRKIGGVWRRFCSPGRLLKRQNRQSPALCQRFQWGGPLEYLAAVEYELPAFYC